MGSLQIRPEMMGLYGFLAEYLDQGGELVAIGGQALTEQEQLVVRGRIQRKLLIRELAGELKVSDARIGQILRKALRKLKNPRSLGRFYGTRPAHELAELFKKYFDPLETGGL